MKSAIKKYVNQANPRLLRIAAFATFILISIGSAWAQTNDPPSPPYVHYLPLPTPIPTLSGLGLLMLSMFLLAAAWQMKRKAQYEGSNFLMIMLVVGALASTASGVKLVSDAIAGYDPNVKLTNPDPNGDFATLHEGLNCVTNISGVAQQIIEINIPNIANNGSKPATLTQSNIPNPGCPTNKGSCNDSPPTILYDNEVCIIDDVPPIPPPT